jgi:hypothetical protein
VEDSELSENGGAALSLQSVARPERQALEAADGNRVPTVVLSLDAARALAPWSDQLGLRPLRAISPAHTASIPVVRSAPENADVDVTRLDDVFRNAFASRLRSAAIVLDDSCPTGIQ